ncbi:hypothetical protein BKA83DRAFT_95383, partial [Pisolithus microcarpus]
YDDVTQEFMATVIREYHAHLCTQAPMPDHAQETVLLSASWARGCQVTSMNLAQSPQLVKLVSPSYHLFIPSSLLTCIHPYFAPLIQKIMNMMWFANKHDDGVMFPNHFKPFPHLALALVLTGICRLLF